MGEHQSRFIFKSDNGYTVALPYVAGRQGRRADDAQKSESNPRGGGGVPLPVINRYA